MADKLTVESYQELKIKGHTETDIAKHFGVSYQTLHKWKKKNLKGKPVKKTFLLKKLRRQQNS
ncbi:helix-turn-helix domain-containing protein [Bacillus velezensis]|nr:helix-turn-helix domain-containing protein [Bacillus velezensis]MDJ1631007.1 helix-turn-helix domain-containing protein [Bacillus velezensis]